MAELHIVTNGHSRDLLLFDQLTEKEQRDFDWDGAEDQEFFRYKGNVYCLGDFCTTSTHPSPDFRKWDGYMSDSFFSGILIKYPNCPFDDGIIVGWYYC